MVDFDSPLDFESEDALVSPQDTKKRRKVIGLDDLLTDYYKERNEIVEKESKWASTKTFYNSDDDDDKTQKAKEAQLSKVVDDCQKQVHGMVAEDDIPSWGQNFFGQQKALPSLDFLGPERCKLLQSSFNNEFNLLLELETEKGETFIDGLLISGWLSKLVLAKGHVEDSLASWTFSLMLYSSNEELQASACEFWLAILPSKNEVNLPSVRLEWFPGYHQLKDALKTYGYLLDSSFDISSLSEDHGNLGCEGPPPNIRSWTKVVSACCHMRSIHSIFSTSEVEEFLGIIILFCLDRKLEGLSLLFDECMQSVMSFFTDEEWVTSSKNVASALAYRIPKDLNCLRLVECISGVSPRSKHLRNEVALQILLSCFKLKVADTEEVLESFLSINLKDRNCKFFKVYIYLVLAENWLFSTEQTRVALRMWGTFLRNCSCQITSTDWRSYASKVRNKASYLLQNMSENFD